MCIHMHVIWHTQILMASHITPAYLLVWLFSIRICTFNANLLHVRYMTWDLGGIFACTRRKMNHGPPGFFQRIHVHDMVKKSICLSFIADLHLQCVSDTLPPNATKSTKANSRNFMDYRCSSWSGSCPSVMAGASSLRAHACLRNLIIINIYIYFILTKFLDSIQNMCIYKHKDLYTLKCSTTAQRTFRSGSRPFASARSVPLSFTATA